MTDATPEAGLTIEQLALETGMSVRNIRNHQTRGLLPSPEVRARIGYYGQRHVERLQLIQQMQADGLKLSAIERLLGNDDGWADRVIGIRRAIASPVETETAEILTLAELEERFGPAEANAKSLLKAQRLGLLINLGDGTFEVPSPLLLAAAQEVVERGIPLGAALSVIEKVQRDARSTSKAFVKLFLDELWKPFVVAGQPDEEWPEIIDTIERLRTIATQALNGVFHPTLAEEIEKAFGKILEDQAKRRI